MEGEVRTALWAAALLLALHAGPGIPVILLGCVLWAVCRAGSR